MDVYFRLLMRMAMWVRRPPSRRQLIVFAVVAAAAVTIVGIEKTIGWPDWARVDQMRGLKLPLHR